MEIAVVSFENLLTLHGGVEVHATRLVEEIQALGHDAVLVTRRPARDHNGVLPDNTHLIDVPIPRGPLAPHQHRTLVRPVWDARVVHATKNIDIVHGMNVDHPNPDVATIHIAPTVHDKPRRPPRAWIQRLVNRYKRKRTQRVVDHATTITVSEAVARDLNHAYETPTQAVIPNGTDPYPLPDPVTGNSRTRQLVYVGRLEPAKRVDRILDATRHLADTWRTTIAGTGSAKESLEAYAEEIGVDDRVTFHGYVQEREKHHLIDDADVVAITSRTEGQPVVAGEAIRHATPLVVTTLDWLPPAYRTAAVPAPLTLRGAKLAQRIIQAHDTRVDVDPIGWDDVARDTIEIYREHHPWNASS